MDKELTIFEKIELVNNAMALAKFFGVEVNQLLALVSLQEDRKDQWNKLVNEVLEFYKLSVPQRMKLYGFSTVRSNNE